MDPDVCRSLPKCGFIASSVSVVLWVFFKLVLTVWEMES